MFSFIECAAHVGHGVAHTDSVKVTLAVTGAVLAGGLVAIATGGVGVAALSAAATWGGIGLDVGRMIANSSFATKSITERLATGFPTVRLGPGLKPAVRAHPDSTPDGCTGDHLFEGSETVMLGPERRPMGRRQDRLDCGGQIMEGLGMPDGVGAVLVGGASSGAGVSLTERESTAVVILDWTFWSVGWGLAALKNPAKAGAEYVTEKAIAAGVEHVAGENAAMGTKGVMGATGATGHIVDVAASWVEPIL